MEQPCAGTGQRLVLLQTKTGPVAGPQPAELTLCSGCWHRFAAGAPWSGWAVLIARDSEQLQGAGSGAGPRAPADAQRTPPAQWLDGQRQATAVLLAVPPSSGWAYAAAEWKKPASGAP